MTDQLQRPALLSTSEAAEYLNVPTRWVQEAVRQRKVRCTRLGKHVRFRVEHLDELVAAGEQPVTGPPVRLTSPEPGWASLTPVSRGPGASGGSAGSRHRAEPCR